MNLYAALAQRLRSGHPERHGRPPSQRRRTPRVVIHPYLGDGIWDYLGEDRCDICGLPHRNAIHQGEANR
jgi:hypothetical protein